MNLNAPVSTIMDTDFYRISADLCIGKAEKIMNKKGMNILAVEENGEFKGLVTNYDCQYFRQSLTRDGIEGPDESLRLKHHKVSEIMNTKLVKLLPTDDIKMASEIMKSIILQVIPVVEKRRLVGLLTPQVIRKCQQRQQRLRTSER
ncbi:CBS domain-containing protein [Portibacter marinus]|uniref:CBS domain-containing protein n=1 Tax=Portibacter marinus TaxID=2898660 RepID=UPI001F334AD6|nr:CBS domain-containing protein [Portibacter marinus]